MAGFTASRAYYGKIMLFGEYSVMEGSSAVLIPYPKVQATLCLPGSCKPYPLALESNRSIQAFAGYLTELCHLKDIAVPFDLTRFTNDVKEGLYLQSSIPENYGLGSSGALCAALFDTYSIPENPEKTFPVQDLQTIFSLMESFFHGSSSGADPLCIYLNEPLVIHHGNYLLPGHAGMQARNETEFFLIDTGRKSHTGPHVQYFRNKMGDEGYRMDFIQKYIPLVNLAVEQWIDGALKESTLLDLSVAQLIFFQPMIPDSLREVWEKGIETGLYGLKLCGSGGGGMVLCYTRDVQATRVFLRKRYGIELM